jgi:regulator of replication initiation timing
VVIRRRQKAANQSLEEIVSVTSAMVGQLLKENRALKAENERLTRELEQVTRGWEEVRKLARSAPRRRSAAR